MKEGIWRIRIINILPKIGINHNVELTVSSIFQPMVGELV